MKNLYLSVVLLLTTILAFAQSPQNINYQAVVRNNVGEVIKNQSVRFKLSVTEGANGTSTYSETHSATTNSLGLVNLTIGAGTVATGTFAAINWANGGKFLKVEVDATGGTNYTLMGTQQLVSVPYALHATTANSILNQWQNNGNSLYYNLGKVGIGTNNPVSKLNILGDESGDVPSGTPDPRRFFHIKNTSISPSAVAYMTLESGPNSNYTAFSHHSSSYSIGELADFGQVLSSGKGLALRAYPTNNNGTNGIIKFMTGVTPDGSNSIERMRISADGKVGIGTDNPGFKLTLQGNESGVYEGTFDPRSFINIRNNSTGQYATANTQLFCGSNTFTKLEHVSPNYFISDFADHGQVWASGKGLILRASPISASDPTATSIKFMTGFRADGGSNERMRISVDGNVGIGTSDPKAKLHLEGNTTGNESTVYDTREYLRIKNNSNSNGSAASLSITAGANAGSTYLWHISPSYTPRPQDQDFTTLYSSGKGVSFWNSPKDNTANGGYFKFQTGLKPDNTGGFDRLVINNVGNVGIGNSDPKAKLEVKDGDVYVNDPTKGIILKSPNGNCWRVTIDNTGNFVRTAIACPN
jgi:hypothetical protein